MISRKYQKKLSKPIAKAGMQINNKLLFIFIKEASFQVRTEVIGPAESTTLAAATEAGELGDGPPATLAVSENKID